MTRALTDKEAMELAIAQAKKGAGWVSPNPLVGAVVLNKDRQVLSTGYHKRSGDDHAEVDALKGLSEEKLKGGHLFVTLEPCAHEGKTPSCAKHLATLPLASVTYGLIDPNPLVAGKGLEILKQKGVAVHKFEGLEDELEQLAEIFLLNMRAGRAFVALKVATSLDGQISRTDIPGQQWLTGMDSLNRVHELRGHYDAVLVGANTVEIDDPHLNIRHNHFPNKRNCAIVLDPPGRLFPVLRSKRLYQAHQPEEIIYVTKGDMRSADGIRVVSLDQDENGHFNLTDLLVQLYKVGITSVMVEGGGQVFSSFLSQRCVDRMHLFMAPLVMGAGRSLSWTTGFVNLKENLKISNIQIERCGSDVYVTGKPVYV